MNPQEIIESFNEHSNQWWTLVPRDSLLSPFFQTSFTMSGGPNLLINEITQEEYIYPDQCWVCQPCLRYWDIENVGDPTHLSFFEMVACSSFLTDGRSTTIKHILDFLTQKCGISLSSIYATVFEGGEVFGCGPFAEDNVGIDILKSLGIHSNHITMVDRSDGFVANQSEPIGGYKVELYIDLTGQVNCSQCIPSKCDCGRFLELVTHVAYEYNISVIDRVYAITPLGNFKMYATGFGVERLEVLLGEGKKIQNISRFANLSNYLNCSEIDKTRFIDTVTALVFLYNDGAGQLSGRKNRERKWILNKWLRVLGEFDKWEANITNIVPKIIELYSYRYPELLNFTLDEVIKDTKLVNK